MRYRLIGLISLLLMSGCSRPLVVAKIISADTIALNTGEKIRYACIACPEPEHPLHRRAVFANRYLVEGKKVEIVREHPLPGDARDTQRAYVYTPVFVAKDEVKYLFVNAELVLYGFAKVLEPSEEPRRKELLESLKALEKKAQNAGQGIWGNREKKAKK